MSKREMLKFYDDRLGYPGLGKLINIGVTRRGLQAESVRQAAEQEYIAMIRTGFDPGISLGHRVYARAKLVPAREHRSLRDKFDNWMHWGEWK